MNTIIITLLVIAALAYFVIRDAKNRGEF